MRVWLLVFLLAVASGCSGAQFHVDDALASRGALAIRGERGFNTEYCDSDTGGPSEGLAAGKPATVGIGPLAGHLGRPHRGVTDEKLASEAVRADFAKVLSAAKDVVGMTDVSIRVETPAGQNRFGLETPAWMTKAVELLEAIDRLINLPLKRTETTVFTYRANIDDRAVLSSCVTTHEAAIFGVFDDPRFRLTCHLLASADSKQRTFAVEGYGNWADFRFRGTLQEEGVEPLVFNSQSTTVMGAGGIRGFDLRRNGPDGGQVAAVSFWHTRETRTQDSLPKAWALPLESQGHYDTVLAVLGLAYAFPWPTGCDAQRIRDEAVAGTSD